MKAIQLTRFDRIWAAVAFAEEGERDTALDLLQPQRPTGPAVPANPPKPGIARAPKVPAH